MFCSKCGAAVNGKFCSCCGQRVRSSAEEYRLTERRLKREFVKAHSGTGTAYDLARMHLAEACWTASSLKHDRTRILCLDDYVPRSLFDGLETVRSYAEELFSCIERFMQI